MPDTRNEVVRSVEDSLRDDGWRKSGPSWYKDGIDTLLVVNLQKSNHSNRYYLNLGVFVAPLPTARPREELAPIHLRVERLPGSERFDPRHLLDLDSPSVGVDRVIRIKRMMGELVLPALNVCQRLEDLEVGGAGRAIVDCVPLLGNEAAFLRST